METTNNNQLALVEPNDLSFVANNSLNAEQLKHILKKTPAQYVKSRPAKGGGQWKYVTGGYIKKCLNLMFGWDWDFEIMSEQVMFDEVIVKGRLTCRSNGKTIVKMQYGNKDIMYKKQTDEDKLKGLPKIPLSIGNDMKAASTDALKKCAAEIGLAADIYNAEDFKEVLVDASEKVTFEQLQELFNEVEDKLAPADLDAANRILSNKETKSYKKMYKNLLIIKNHE